MLKIFVDSGSSIKQSEKEAEGVEILPLKLTIGDKEYDDGIDLDMEDFYRFLINDKLFPRTSLPSLGETEERVNTCLANGDKVVIVTISSGISGTFNALRTLFENRSDVLVIDSKTAVGGVRILVREIRKLADQPLSVIEEHIKALIPRVRVVAVPDTLEYLHRGGRLSRSAWMIGSALQLKPLIDLDTRTDGSVTVVGKVLGKKRAIKAIADWLTTQKCDPSYPIIPSYTYDKSNLDALISQTNEKYKAQMTEYDELDPVISCHWGPSAFGYIFVAGE
ncbi:MAG: DegV family protein [Clostridia bacterium]|nr:DegV family protein [Clostridia bacterium]